MRYLFGLEGEARLWFPILVWTMGALGVVVGVALGVYLLKKYRDSKCGKCRSQRRMEGKVVVVTGANSGIGKEAARDLASRGAVVILACRNRGAAHEAVKEIRTTTGDGDLIVMLLDLGDLDSVRTFASNLLEKFNKIDVLINNAGVYVPPQERRKTKDGFEIHFGINHLGHFLLTHLLLDRLTSTPNSRIVIVSSLLYKSGKIDFDNLDAEKGWDKKARNPLYSASKLANIFHSQELAKRLAGTSVGVYVLCPGFVYTGLFRYSAQKVSWFMKLCMAPFFMFYMRSAKLGAQTTIHCAVSEELDGTPWAFLRECGRQELSEVAQDPATAACLWDVSMALVGEQGSVGEGSVADSEEGVMVEEEGLTGEREEEEAVMVEVGSPQHQHDQQEALMEEDAREDDTELLVK